MSVEQQIIISGLGGQGVLFVTKLLAETAMAENYKVLTSETHGMAQRGGIVISYLKIGDFSGPLIRPGKADALIALKEETFHHHGYLVKDNGFSVVNSPSRIESNRFFVYSRDAETLAIKAGNPQSVNVVMLGYFTAVLEKKCDLISLAGICKTIEHKLGGKKQVLESVLGLLESGYKLFD
ncbi:2-oxoacid:acceptor oxidoreductase family protein [Desulfobacula phenolica]|uniref:Indolepyruvate ferredoxin oxidoreductase beta subunit n=1 Tax=Desulfobacula phenolica TaxID=90732 RepID=A0A1H2DQ02_9BACT|nr:2-oxoacid:acceptor oxidoreductase family protein [Desulfobacula phenolica]SDT84977.1 indolepyruvate ferredoxin oxidoreductase beta subunit [Desulfobacula phenolica]